MAKLGPPDDFDSLHNLILMTVNDWFLKRTRKDDKMMHVIIVI